MAVDDFVEFEEKVDLGSGWSAIGFWCRPGALVRIRLHNPADGSIHYVDADLDLVKATFVDVVPCASSGTKVERLVLGISCELSSSTLELIE